MKTYGTLDHFKGSWVVTAEPHVVIRLRRVFPRMARRQDFVGLADTLETSRELEWFVSRFPLAYKTPAVESRLADRANQHREKEHVVDQLVTGQKKPTAFRLALPAREYQRVAADLALQTMGLLIADDLGSGKTVTTICALTDPRTRPALIVTLTHLPQQWERELRKFAPRLSAHILRGTRPYNVAKQMADGKLPDVILTSYSKLSGWKDYLADIPVASVTFDECQELRRGSESEKGIAAYLIASKAKFRIGLSATPIVNYGGEIHNVLEAIAPGALGTKTEFSKEWCTGDGRKLKIKDPKAFGTYARASGLMIRRTRKEIGREIPPVSTIPHHVDSDQEYLATVESAATKLAQIIMSKQETARGEKFRASEELSALVRQATGVAKAGYVAEFVRLLVENDEPVVLFGWHRLVYDIWLERLKEFNPVLYTGSETPSQKEASRQAFITGESKVLIMSLRSGAGLDGLQFHCRTVVFGELDWSPGIHEQCAGRVARDGQADPVCVYYLLSDSGSDPIVADVLGVKKGQIEGLRDPNGELVEDLQVDPDHVKRLAQSYLEKRARRSA